MLSHSQRSLVKDGPDDFSRTLTRVTSKIAAPLRRGEDPEASRSGRGPAVGVIRRIRALGLAVVRAVVWAGEKLVAPLRRGEGPNKFRLSSMDTATTTYDGDTGWASRPPATLECRQCGSEILQHHARDDIDCGRCVAEYGYDEFADLDLLYLSCPVCRNRMEHGKRHPDQFDVPQWATCTECRYHWEFDHTYDG